MLAWDGFWPSLGFGKAKAVGLGQGFGCYETRRKFSLPPKKLYVKHINVPNILLYTNFIIELKDQYFEMYGKEGTPKSTHVKGNKNLAKLLAEDTTDKKELSTPTPTAVASKPWRTEFNWYLDGNDEVPNGMLLPQWWGVTVLSYISRFRFQLIFVFSRSTLHISLSGLRWPMTTLQSWAPQFQASMHSHLLGSP